MKPHQIIPNHEITRVHGNANFGSMPKRQVVNEALLKFACGYHNGSTAQAIIEDHGLVVGSRLTKRGREYLWSVYAKGLP